MGRSQSSHKQRCMDQRRRRSPHRLHPSTRRRLLALLPKAAGLLRCGKSCRLRWINYLRPDLKRGNFTEQDDDLIIKLHSHLGNKWSLIAARLPGRTDNEIKSYWNTHIKRKLLNRGIDPANHRPLNESTAAHDVTSTISFTCAKQGEEKINNINNINPTEFLEKDEMKKIPVKETCPDLNLDLRISPPYLHQSDY